MQTPSTILDVMIRQFWHKTETLQQKSWKLAYGKYQRENEKGQMKFKTEAYVWKIHR